MRLKYLKIKGYKNLEDFDLNLEDLDSNLVMLIGNNGSGKSNLLEALSAIFANLYNEISLPEGMRYEMKYQLLSGAIIDIKYTDRFQIRLNESDIYKDELTQNYLPSKVIAVYSGEETRLWEDFYQTDYDKYRTGLITGKISTLKMPYINKYYWAIGLLSLYIKNKNSHEIISILEEINVNDNSNITIIFNKNNKEKYLSKSILKDFVNDFNENDAVTIKMSLKDFFEKLGVAVANDANKIFEYFAQLYLPKKNKIIDKIEIDISGKSLRSISEGQKKKILIESVLNVISDENSLILFDEPDSHIHESNKKEIYNLIKKKNIAQSIVTTHSVMMTRAVENDKEIFMIGEEDKKVKIIGKYGEEILKKLLPDPIERGSFLNSKKDLLMVEGHGDVEYIKKAIKYHDKYKIDLDILPMGGANSPEKFLKILKGMKLDEAKKIIFLFDRDGPGYEGMKKLMKELNPDSSITGGITNTDTHNFERYYSLLLPVISGHSYQNFLIEDYFGQERIAKEVTELIQSKSGFNEYPSNLKDSLKITLAKIDDQESYKNFEFLIAELFNILKGGINQEKGIKPIKDKLSKTKEQKTKILERPQKVIEKEIGTKKIVGEAIIKQSNFYVQKAIKNYDNREYREAISNFSKALELNSENYSIYCERGMAHLSNRDYKSAISDLTQYTKKESSNYNAYKLIAEANYELKDYKKSIEAYKKVTDINPLEYETFSNLGNVESILGNYINAKKALEKSVEINPDFAEGWINLGLVFLEQKENEKALECMEKAISLKPEGTNFYYNRGKVYKEMKKYDEAIKDYQRTIEMYPYDDEAYSSMGVIYRMQNKEKEAFYYFYEALKINPKNLCAYIHIISIKINNKDYEGAIRDCQEILKEYPKDTELQKLLDEANQRLNKN